MKVLIAGLGSIGQRHARNLRARFGDRVELVAYRERGLPHTITESMTVEPGVDVERRYGIRAFDCLDAALDTRPDAAFICNPTSRHLWTAQQAAGAGCHLLIEKPLSHDLSGVDELIETADARGLVATVGYQLRFHPALLRVRQLLCERAIGSVVTVHAEFGEYLPAAHPYEDYRHSYAARADLGGGVILCYIHEVDYLYWLFGLPVRVSTAGGRLGALEIDVEDTAVSTLEFRVDGRPVIAQLHQSFLMQPPSRRCAIVGTTGTIHLDLREPSVQVSSSSHVMRDAFESFQRNHLFEQELAHFFSAIDGRHAPAVPLRQAAQSLRIAAAMRASLETGKVVELQP